jgi:hypothetical protein
MDLEARIRSRIETILISDARKHADVKLMAASDEPFDEDPFEEERNLYQRIINNYRSAVNDTNALLEENIAFLSSFCRIVDNIKEKENFHEICSVILDSLLQDLGVEYCGIVLFEDAVSSVDPLYLEGICEDQKFVYIHSKPQLLGSREFEEAVAALVRETRECFNVPDVNRESRFNGVDFPSVVRSLVCLPILFRNEPAGALLISHSLPHFFNENHIRLLKILSGVISHLKYLTAKRTVAGISDSSSAAPSAVPASCDVISIILMSFDLVGADGDITEPDREVVLGLRGRLAQLLEPGEVVLLYEDKELLMLLPGTPADRVPARVGKIREAFLEWKSSQPEKLRAMRISLGFSTCEGTEDIARTLEIASIMIHPDEEI